MRDKLVEQIESERAKEKKGWEVVEFSFEHKDLGALLNGMEIIQNAKIKEQTFCRVLTEVIKSGK